jgi:uncharacterized membrane protein YfcA
MYILFLLIALGASIIGSICGIGGGLIIKPVLDASGTLGVAAINFVSGCTVLAMSAYAVISSGFKRTSQIDIRICLPLAIGAVIGGITGKHLFHIMIITLKNENNVGIIQAVCLMIITAGTLIYTARKEKISTHHFTSLVLCIAIGVILGLISSFLGIGGGPINLIVLFYFFSMDTKTAAASSIYMIFFSQLASLMNTIMTHNIPAVDMNLMLIMICAGIIGAAAGKKINERISEKIVDKLFIILMILLILINIYDIYLFVS